MASTTKIMTALLAVESAEDAEIVETPESETEEFLKRKVRVADEAVGAEGSSIYLKKGESVSDTALSCGFSDYSNFIRTFKSIVGVSPGKYAGEENSGRQIEG